MTAGMMIYLLICGLIGLALVVLALMSLIENWFKRRTKDVVLDACSMFWGAGCCPCGVFGDSRGGQIKERI